MAEEDTRNRPLVSPLGKRDRSISQEFSEKKRVVTSDPLSTHFPASLTLTRGVEVITTNETQLAWVEGTGEIIATATKATETYPLMEWPKITSKDDYLHALDKYHSQVPWNVNTWCKQMDWTRYAVPGNGWCLLFAILSSAWKMDFSARLPEPSVIAEINVVKSQAISKVLQEDTDAMLAAIFDVDVAQKKEESLELYEAIKSKHLQELQIWRDKSVGESLPVDFWGSYPLIKIMSRELNVKILCLTESADENYTYGELTFPDTRRMADTAIPIKQWLAHLYVPESDFNEPILLCFVHTNHYDALIKPRTAHSQVQKNRTPRTRGKTLVQPKVAESLIPPPTENPKGLLGWTPTSRPEGLLGGQKLAKLDPQVKAQNEKHLEAVKARFSQIQSAMLQEEKWKNQPQLEQVKALWGTKAPLYMREAISRLDEKLIYIRDMKKNRNVWGSEIELQMQEQKLTFIQQDQKEKVVAELAKKALNRLKNLSAQAGRNTRKSILADPGLWRNIEKASKGKYLAEFESPTLRPNVWRMLAVISEITPRVALLKLLEDQQINIPPEIYSSEHYLYTSLLVKIYEKDEHLEHALDRIARQNDWEELDGIITQWVKAVEQEESPPGSSKSQ